MKKGYKILASIFITAILVLSGGTAMADWVADSAAGPKTVITNGGNVSALVQVGTPAKATFLVASGQEVANGGIVTFTLTGGATFSTTEFTATSSNGSVSFNRVGSSIGATSVKFIVSSGSAMSVGEGIRFATTDTAINVSGVPSGGFVDFQITIATASNLELVSNASYKAKATASAAPISAESLFQPTFGLLTAVADVKATSGPYTKFENDMLSTGTPATGTSSGNVTFNFKASATTVPASTSTFKGKMLVTLVGDFTGITKVTCDAGLTGSDSSGLTTGGTVGQFLINAAKTAAYATNNNAAPPTYLSAQFYIDGTTPQGERSFTVKVESFADSSTFNAGTWLGPVKFFSLTRNGVFFTSNSIGQYNTIKISDKSGAVPTGGAKVLISAYDANGTKLADAAGNVDILLQNNQTIELTGTQMAARFVGTAMKYEVAVTTTSGAVTNVKKTPEGFGSNVWSTNGGTL